MFGTYQNLFRPYRDVWSGDVPGPFLICFDDPFLLEIPFNSKSDTFSYKSWQFITSSFVKVSYRSSINLQSHLKWGQNLTEQLNNVDFPLLQWQIWVQFKAPRRRCLIRAIVRSISFLWMAIDLPLPWGSLINSATHLENNPLKCLLFRLFPFLNVSGYNLRKSAAICFKIVHSYIKNISPFQDVIIIGGKIGVPLVFTDHRLQPDILHASSLTTLVQ